MVTHTTGQRQLKSKLSVRKLEKQPHLQHITEPQKGIGTDGIQFLEEGIEGELEKKALIKHNLRIKTLKSPLHQIPKALFLSSPDRRLNILIQKRIKCLQTGDY